MADKKDLLITPKTKVGELLDAYPELEPVLMNLAPAFKKLKNPVLRKTVGKVATLQQAASLGGIQVTEIINTLRAEVGQESFDKIAVDEEIMYEKPVILTSNHNILCLIVWPLYHRFCINNL